MSAMLRVWHYGIFLKRPNPTHTQIKQTCISNAAAETSYTKTDLYMQR